MSPRLIVAEWSARSCRAAATRRRATLPLCLVALAIGCTSNRFELANRRESQLQAEELERMPPPQDPVAMVPAAPVGPIPAYPPEAAIRQNPNPAETGAINQGRLAQTPPPGPPGSTLERFPQGPELAGRVVNPYGQSEAGASIQVLDASRGGQVIAEVASARDGSFRVLNLVPGAQYELRAASNTLGRRLFGSAIAVPPNTAVLLQLDFESNGDFSPLGNRLSTTTPEQQIAGNRPTGPPREPTNRGGLLVATPVLMGRPEPLPIASPYRQTPPRPMEIAPTQFAGTRQPIDDRPRAFDRADAAPHAAPGGDDQFDDDRETPRPRRNALSEDASKESDSRTGQLDLAPTRSEGLAFAKLGLERAGMLGLDGSVKQFGEVRGEVILVDFFGSWCGPCRAAVPKIKQLGEKYASLGLEIVGVACENGDDANAVDAARQLVEDLDIRYTVLVSPLDAPSTVRQAFRVNKYPTVVLLDRAGNILFESAGGDALTFARLERAIQDALRAARR